ncbi:MAG: hypothetical protein GY708_29050 [Actinomycetia bacterium]|nr:hypothetical protein [Actinomycetes bacterium]
MSKASAATTLGRCRRSALLVLAAAASLATFVSPSDASASAEFVGIDARPGGTGHVIIEWETDVATTATLVFGLGPTYGQAWIDPALSTRHRADLYDLECDSEYHFAIVSINDGVATNTGDRTFHTSECEVGDGAASPPTVVVYQHHVSISWTSSRPGRGTVVYGESVDYSAAATEPDHAVDNHRIVIDDLACGSTYHFAAISRAEDGVAESTADHVFTTYECTPFIHHVDVQAGETTTTFTWMTDAVAEGTVVFGETDQYDQEVRTNVLETTHRIDLTGLSCATTYHYRIVSIDELGATHRTPSETFTTALCDAVDPIPGLPGQPGPIDETPPTPSEPAAQLGETSLSIEWTTDVVASAAIVWGTDETLDNEASGSAVGTEHRVDLYDLTCETDYMFQTISTGATGVSSRSQVTVVTTAGCGSGIEIDPPVTVDPIEPVDPPGTDPAPAPEVADVAVVDITKSSATVTWSTNVSATGIVSYGADLDLDHDLEVSGVIAGLTQRIVLADLVCDTVYRLSATATTLDGVRSTGVGATFVTSSCDSTEIFDVETHSSDHALVVVWRTDIPADSMVLFGRDISYGATAYAPTVTVDHEIVLNELECDTEYHFRVVSNPLSGAATFTSDLVAITQPCVEPTPISSFAHDTTPVFSGNHKVTTDVYADELDA